MKLERNPHLIIKNDVITFGDILFLQQKDRAQHQFQVLMGEENLNPKMIENFQNNMTHNISIAKRDGFDYKHIVFPCKPIVFREKFQNIGVELNPIFSDQHHHPQVFYPKVLPEDYFLEDSHINVAGTLKIVEQVMQEFGYPKLPEPILEDHALNGDLRNMLEEDGLENTKIMKGFSGLPTNHVKCYSTYSSLKGNTGHLQFFFNPYALYNRRLVLFGDSFFQRRQDVFKRIFSEVIYFRNPYILDDVVKILEPDVVLTGNAERYLWNVPNCDKPKPWFMNYISDKYDSQKIPEVSIKAFSALFSGKESSAYKKIFGRKLSNLPRCMDKLSEIADSDIQTDADINFIKGMASHYQDKSPEIASHLLTLAKNANM